MAGLYQQLRTPGVEIRIVNTMTVMATMAQVFRLDLDRYPTNLLDMVNSGVEPAAGWAREAMTNSTGDQCEIAVVDGGFVVTVTSGKALLLPQLVVSHRFEVDQIPTEVLPRSPYGMARRKR